MGMAASQARYLGLTARKTNVEYEGQQINQARTALGNQSAALWNQMLGLSIPTVPSITDYTTLTYSFSDGINNYTITDMQSVDKKETDGTEYNKLVTYKTLTTVYKGVESTNSNPQVQHVFTPTNLVDKLKTDVQYKKTDSSDPLTTAVDGEGNVSYTIGGNAVTFNEIAEGSPEYIAYLKANNLTELTDKLYSYEVDGQTKFLSIAELPTTAGTSDIASQIISKESVNYTIGGNAVTFTEVDSSSDEYKNYLTANKLDKLTTPLYSYQTSEGETKYTTATLPTTDGTVDLNSETITMGYRLGNSEAKVCLPGDKNTSLVDQEAIKQIINDFGKDGGITQAMFEAGEVYRYEKNGNVYYTTKTELEDCWNKSKHDEQEYSISSKMDFQPSLTHYYATNLDEVITSTDYAIMDDASGSGRYANIKLKNMSTKFNLKAEETTNQAAYNDAMNQYNYDLTKYEKQMSDINAKTSLIQEQDRTLELRLKQLETEQKALTTEMDAVKGVLQKNVESTFGTFK